MARTKKTACKSTGGRVPIPEPQHEEDPEPKQQQVGARDPDDDSGDSSDSSDSSDSRSESSHTDGGQDEDQAQDPCGGTGGDEPPEYHVGDDEEGEQPCPGWT